MDLIRYYALASLVRVRDNPLDDPSEIIRIEADDDPSCGTWLASPGDVCEHILALRRACEEIGWDWDRIMSRHCVSDSQEPRSGAQD